jgi:RTA1 like protein
MMAVGLNAFDYMVLGRMIHFFVPSKLLFGIPASTLALGFVSLDFVSFVVQLVGGSSSGPTSPASQQLKAIHIYMGGIGLQQFFIVVFIVLAVKFQLEMTKAEKFIPSGGGSRRNWRPLLFTLYTTLVLITVSRSFEGLSSSFMIAAKKRTRLDPHYLPYGRILWWTNII